MQTILVTDEPSKWEFLKPITPIVEASDYLSNVLYQQGKALRIINLCNSYDYQTIGYYVSLLAQARDHKAVPSVLNIQDVINVSLYRQMSEDMDKEIQQNLQDIQDNEFTISIYFGQNVEKKYSTLAKTLHNIFPLPLIQIALERKKRWGIKNLRVISISDVPQTHYVFLQQAAQNYLSKKRFHQWQKKQRFHNLAILIDHHESNPPSNKKALDLFIEIGETLGINVDLIDKHDSKFIAEYDALFIRTTTAVDHFTYRIARRAVQENLVVIDDPQSIVKCTNKVYFAELMRNHQILTPSTLFISKYDKELPIIQYPCVLKKPDGALSQGVIKIDDVSALKRSLKQFFKTSDLVLIQPFIPTEFDWRIGIIDNKPLYASRYYMAKDHWQIYNWNASEVVDGTEIEGADDSVPLNEVPEIV